MGWEQQQRPWRHRASCSLRARRLIRLRFRLAWLRLFGLATFWARGEGGRRNGLREYVSPLPSFLRLSFPLRFLLTDDGRFLCWE